MFKRTSICFLLLLAWSAPAWAVNWLTNPGLTGATIAPTSWNQVGLYNQLVDGVTYKTGTPSRKFVAVASIYQDVAYSRVAGDNVTFSAYMMNKAENRLTGSRSGVVQLEFYNAAGIYIGTTRSANALNASSTLNTWINIIGMGVVPTGTRTIRFEVLMINADYGTGIFNVDDCSLDWTAGETPEATFTPTFTYTNTPVCTPSYTPTKTATPTPKNTATSTITKTATPTFTVTRTATPTATPFSPGTGLNVSTGIISLPSVAGTPGGWVVSVSGTTREAVLHDPLGYGLAAPLGSVFLSTAGKVYIRTGTGGAATDYQKVSMTASD